MARERPINAEVPAPRRTASRRRSPRRAATEIAEALAAAPPDSAAAEAGRGAILLAAVFLVAAILGGGNGRNSVDGAAPLVGGDTDSARAARPAPEESTEELGYPAFATKNTTRVGGGDPAANAAGAALAVFPATDEAQRPAAVTLVDEAEPRGRAIAAAVLMSAPVRAPVLVAGEDGMPAVSAEALAALDPGGSSSTGGASVFAIGDVPTPAGLRDQAGAGGGSGGERRGDREAARPALRLPAPPHRRRAARRAGLRDAGRRLGGALRRPGPLRRAPRSCRRPTARVLRSQPKVPAYVLGPSSAISSDVLREVAAIAPRVRRVAGEDPVANAIALARYDDGGFGWNVNDPGHGFVVARSDEPLDAAAAAPLSAAGTWGPLLLTDDAGTLPAALRGYLLDVKPGYTEDPTRAFYNHVWVIGDQEAIEVGQQAEIDALAELAKIGGRR